MLRTWLLVEKDDDEPKGFHIVTLSRSPGQQHTAACIQHMRRSAAAAAATLQGGPGGCVAEGGCATSPEPAYHSSADGQHTPLQTACRSNTQQRLAACICWQEWAACRMRTFRAHTSSVPCTTYQELTTPRWLCVGILLRAFFNNCMMRKTHYVHNYCW
jgi:hypothetical protein